MGFFEREEEATNDGDSNGDLFFSDSDKELHAILNEESIDEDFLGLAEKLHQTQTALFRATNP